MDAPQLPRRQRLIITFPHPHIPPKTKATLSTQGRFFVSILHPRPHPATKRRVLISCTPKLPIDESFTASSDHDKKIRSFEP